jgi:hypothetical protein
LVVGVVEFLRRKTDRGEAVMASATIGQQQPTVI